MVEKKGPFQLIANIIMILLALCCLFPFLLLIMSSITDEQTLIREGYSIIPSKFGFQSYAYLWKNAAKIGRAYGITILVTVVGTTVSLLMTVMMAYPLSRREFFGRNVCAFFVFFTMLFNGGLVPTYIMYTRYLHIKNTIWAAADPLAADQCVLCHYDADVLYHKRPGSCSGSRPDRRSGRVADPLYHRASHEPAHDRNHGAADRVRVLERLEKRPLLPDRLPALLHPEYAQSDAQGRAVPEVRR